MNCPVCQCACNEETYEGLVIEVCSKCQGVWLDSAQLATKRERIFKENEVEAVNRLCGANGARQESASRNLPCPKCAGGEMQSFSYQYSSAIIVDRCAQGCGLWLDADELEKVQIHAELWQDKLEANRERFSRLAGQVESDLRKTFEAINNSVAPSRFRFVNCVIRGLVKF